MPLPDSTVGSQQNLTIPLNGLGIGCDGWGIILDMVWHLNRCTILLWRLNIGYNKCATWVTGSTSESKVLVKCLPTTMSTFYSPAGTDTGNFLNCTLPSCSLHFVGSAQKWALHFRNQAFSSLQDKQSAVKQAFKGETKCQKNSWVTKEFEAHNWESTQMQTALDPELQLKYRMGAILSSCLLIVWCSCKELRGNRKKREIKDSGLPWR